MNANFTHVLSRNPSLSLLLYCCMVINQCMFLVVFAFIAILFGELFFPQTFGILIRKPVSKSLAMLMRCITLETTSFVAVSLADRGEGQGGTRPLPGKLKLSLNVLLG